MARHVIPDYLLKTTVAISEEAGVSSSRIRAAINAFAAEPEEKFTGDIAGFLTVADIPQSRRAGFMSLISSFATQPA
jgi:hypothetical protein